MHLRCILKFIWNSSIFCELCVAFGDIYSFALSTLQVRPASQKGGVLFAITDARQKVVELGLALTPVIGGFQSILLYYTEKEQASHSHKAASFSVPDMTDQWSRFTVSKFLRVCKDRSMVQLSGLQRRAELTKIKELKKYSTNSEAS